MAKNGQAECTQLEHMGCGMLASVFHVGRYQMLPHKLRIFFPNQFIGWFFNPEEQTLWLSSNTNWMWHSIIPLQSRTLSFHSHREQLEPPLRSLHCATIQVHDTKVVCMGSGAIAQLLEPTDCMATFQQHFFSQNWQWEVIVVGSLQELVEGIMAGKGYSMSNGSFQAR